MKSTERLLQCKIKLGIKTDYKLAQALGINRARVHNYMAGKATPDVYAAIKMAEILKVHPLMLVAEFEEEAAKDEKKKAFWSNFAQRIKTGALGMLVLTFTAFWSPGAEAAGLTLDTHNVYYVKLQTLDCTPKTENLGGF